MIAATATAASTLSPWPLVAILLPVMTALVVAIIVSLKRDHS